MSRSPPANLSVVSLFMLLSAGLVHASSVIGRASIIDGDTFDMHGKGIRLHGIDGPESR